MSKIKIVTDSSITIEPELIKLLDITVVPLSVMIDGTLYSDNDLKEPGKFLQMMKEGKNLPKTSQPPVGLFAENYERIANESVDKIISIHLTHSLSGTVEAARQGANLAGVPVHVIDSGFIDQAMKFQVITAAKLAQEGADEETILEAIKEVEKNTSLFIGVSTLENLVKGGRIGRVTGLISSLLNIKVIMQLINHELVPVVKGRGNKTFSKWLDDFIEQNKNRKIKEIGISYCGTEDYAMQLREKLQVLNAPISVLETGSTVQTHTGENVFAIMTHYED
ncbi:MAG: DegV family protein [Streptococcus sp.]|nr:DegV family protein [Streptococcus sp.]